ncbi:MAG: cupredoxin domain-containing protein [Candidatus Eiseniibacteriota bacterium]
MHGDSGHTGRTGRIARLRGLALALPILASLALSLSCGPSSGTKTPAATSEQRVAMTVDGSGFHPDRIPARVGQPVTLAITRTTNETCGTEIVIPAEQIRKDLPLNQTVEVTITPAASGEIAFACGMDMLKGSIVAE